MMCLVTNKIGRVNKCVAYSNAGFGHREEPLVGKPVVVNKNQIKWQCN